MKKLAPLPLALASGKFRALICSITPAETQSHLEGSHSTEFCYADHDNDAQKGNVTSKYYTSLCPSIRVGVDYKASTPFFTSTRTSLAQASRLKRGREPACSSNSPAANLPWLGDPEEFCRLTAHKRLRLDISDPSPETGKVNERTLFQRQRIFVAFQPGLLAIALTAQSGAAVSGTPTAGQLGRRRSRHNI